MLTDFSALTAELSRIPNQRRVGRVTAVGTAALEIAGLSHHARIGDQVAIGVGGGASQPGEIGGEVVGVGPERGRGVPRVEDRAVGCGGREAGAGGAVGARCSAHAVDRIRDGFAQVTG